MQLQPSYRVVQLGQPDQRLLESLKKLHYELRTYHGSAPQTEHFVDFVTRRLGNESMLLAFGLAGDTPVGYSLAFDVFEHPFMPDWRRAGYITQLFVTSEHRRRGVGKQMLDFVIRWLAHRGVSNVLLNVSVENPLGNRFWQENGFTPYLVRMKRTISQ